MKKITALKNKETGEINTDVFKIHETSRYYTVESDEVTKNDYSKVTCLLIEESELREKIIKEETKFEQGWNTAIRTILDKYCATVTLEKPDGTVLSRVEYEEGTSYFNFGKILNGIRIAEKVYPIVRCYDVDNEMLAFWKFDQPIHYGDTPELQIYWDEDFRGLKAEAVESNTPKGGKYEVTIQNLTKTIARQLAKKINKEILNY